MMSQQMQFDEERRGYEGTRAYEAAYTPTMGEGSGTYDRRFAEMPAQKIAANYVPDQKSSPSAGQRLALAIVSMIVLIGALFALTVDAYTSMQMIAARLVGVIVVCLSTVAINFIFGRRR